MWLCTSPAANHMKWLRWGCILEGFGQLQHIRHAASQCEALLDHCHHTLTA